MYKIIKAEKLNEIVYLMVVEAPMVAKHCQPGQFIIVKEDDAGERLSLIHIFSGHEHCILRICYSGQSFLPQPSSMRRQLFSGQ